MRPIPATAGYGLWIARQLADVATMATDRTGTITVLGLNRSGFARGSAHCLMAADAAGLAFAEVEGPGSTLLDVGAERDELRRLIEQLPDDRVRAVLAEARRQSGSVPAGEWPPSWFGSFVSGRSDLGSNHDDLLAEGFGRP